MQGNDRSWTYFGSQVGMQQHVAIWVDGKSVAIGSKLYRKRVNGDGIQ